MLLQVLSSSLQRCMDRLEQMQADQQISSAEVAESMKGFCERQEKFQVEQLALLRETAMALREKGGSRSLSRSPRGASGSRGLSPRGTGSREPVRDGAILPAVFGSPRRGGDALPPVRDSDFCISALLDETEI